MNDDRPLIILTSTFRKLQRMKGLWYTGWVVTTLGLATASYSFARAQSYREAYERSLADVTKLRSQVVVMQDEQRLLTESYLKAWKNQQETADLLLSWGSVVQEQKDIKNFNRKNAPINLVRISE